MPSRVWKVVEGSRVNRRTPGAAGPKEATTGSSRSPPRVVWKSSTGEVPAGAGAISRAWGSGLAAAQATDRAMTSSEQGVVCMAVQGFGRCEVGNLTLSRGRGDRRAQG